MTEEFRVVARYNGKELELGLKKSGKSVKTFGDNTEKAGKKSKIFEQGLSGATKAAGALVAALGIREVKQFADETVRLSRSEIDARNALTATVGSLERYKEIISQVAIETQGMTSEQDAASLSNALLDQGITKTAGSTAKLVNTAVILADVLKAQGASVELALRLFSSGNAVLLDNFNISLRQVNIRRKQLEANDRVSKSESRLQAIRELAIEKAEKYTAAISDETKAQRQAEAKAIDMKAALGDLLVPAYTSTAKAATKFFGVIEDGADQWSVNIDQAGVLKDTLDELLLGFGLTAAGQDLLSLSVQGTRSAIENQLQSWANLGVEGAKLLVGEKALTDAVVNSVEAREAASEVASLTLEEIEAEENARDELEAQLDAETAARQKLTLTTSSFFGKLADLQKEAAETEREFAEAITEATQTAADDRLSITEDLEKDRASIIESTADKMRALRGRVTTENAGSLQLRLQALKDEQNEEIVELEAKAEKEKQIAIDKEAELKEIAKARREEEKAEQEKELQETIIFTALKQAEVAGTLEEITGLAGLNAKQATDLILSGMIDINDTAQAEIAKTASIMETDLEKVTQTADRNLSIVGDIISGDIKVSTRAASSDVAGLGRELDQLSNQIEGVNRQRRFLDPSVDAGLISSLNQAQANIPQRVHGGPVNAGERIMVGERGMEEFIPNQNGQIVNNNNTTNNNKFNATFNGLPSAGVPQDLAMFKSLAAGRR